MTGVLEWWKRWSGGECWSGGRDEVVGEVEWWECWSGGSAGVTGVLERRECWSEGEGLE